MSAGKKSAITCPSCQTVNEPFAAFCHKCGAPIGSTATLVPMNVVQTEGYVFRRALEGRPKLVVLVGVWVLFLPTLLVAAGVAINLIVNHSSRSDFVFFWLSVGLSYLSMVVLYRVTKNYFTIPARGPEDDVESS